MEQAPRGLPIRTATGGGIDQAPVKHYRFRGRSFTLVPRQNLSCEERLMAKEVVKSGKTLRVADEEWLLIEDAVAPVVPSLFVEARHFAGVVYLSLAQSVVDVGNPPEARVCARLRFDLRFAQALRDQLGKIIDDALKPVDRSKAN